MACYLIVPVSVSLVKQFLDMRDLWGLGERLQICRTGLIKLYDKQIENVRFLMSNEMVLWTLHPVPNLTHDH